MDSSRGNKFDYVVTGLLKVNNNVVGTSYNLKSLFPTRRINYGPPKCASIRLLRNASTLTTGILKYYYAIVFEYSSDDYGKKNHLNAFRNTYCCKNDEHFRRRRVEEHPRSGLLVYLNWKILHALHGKAMECIGKYNRQIFQTRALNIDRNVFN